ncbi:MAG: hypothetical protein ONB48_12035 [candidate division KSB1 bacterium]|nr:hypothetical protein [candidate division KSB1 bacterium]MDZ7274001.1 hypothetical protein [candidate division KSB1 bacterium]MDZ7286374.1 hypothetical protein [candidate division KSB1 bacterium]MDZ7296602.1 hypothetical protein [candidate division KSB1 bacterium]MDZ7309016.1 hypothetical protein [candidate division KSB1 bacterium]
MSLQRLVFCLFVLLLVGDNSRTLAQSGLANARSFGMAGAYLALARGAEVSSWNPANLGLRDNPARSLHFLALGLHISNNAFAKNDYHLYNGAWLSEKDKETILQLIPSDGLRFQVGSEATLAAYSHQHLAVTVALQGFSSGRLQRDFIALALQGNVLNRRYELAGNHGSAFAAVVAGFSFGRPVSLPLLTRHVREFAAGITISYLHGLAAAEVREAGGAFLTTWEGLSGDGRARMRIATGGHGLAFDCGTTAVINRHWSIGLAMRHLLSAIYWNHNVREYEWGVHADSLTARSWNDNPEAALQSWSWERRGPAFFSSLPPMLHAGIAWRRGCLQMTADVVQPLRRTAALSRRPDLRLGCEARYWSFLPLRLGVNTGGGSGWGTAFGLGYNHKTFAVDMGAQTRGGLLPSAGKGAGLALGMRLQR